MKIFPRAKSRPLILQAKSVLLCAFFASACSPSNSKGANTTSPYDLDFDQTKQDEATVVYSDQSELDLFYDAISAYDRGLYSLSREKWTSLRNTFPSSYLATYAELKSADTFMYSGDYAAALVAYEEFIRLHPAHEAAAYVRFQIANAQRLQYQGPEHDQSPLLTAIKSFKKLQEDYPESEFILPARRMINICRENLAEHEALVAAFYEKQGAHQASTMRYERLADDYADSAAARAHYQTEIADVPLKEGEENPPPSVTSGAASVADAPQTPDLVFKQSTVTSRPTGSIRSRLADEEKTIEGASAKLKEPLNEENINVPVTENSPLLELHCEQSGAFYLFTADLRSQLILGKPTAKQTTHGAEAEVLLRPGDSKVATKTTGETLVSSCGSGVVFLKVFARKKVDGTLSAPLRFTLNLPSKKIRYHFFQLDRPLRAVAVVEIQ